MLIPDYFSPELKGYRCLSELTVGILGIGQIGLSSAKLLKGFIFLKQTSATTSNLCLFAGLGCKVLGLVSKERTPTETDVVTQYFTKPQLPQLLSSVDYLINILPSTPDTDNILSRLVGSLILPYYSVQPNKSVFYFHSLLFFNKNFNQPTDELKDLRLYKQRRALGAPEAPHQTMFTFQRSSEKL